MIYLGLMSGTSMDGIDAVAARFDHAEFREIIATLHADYPAVLRERLLGVARQHTPLTARDWCALDAAVAEAFAAAALQLMQAHPIAAAEITAIGSHGQTVFHDATDEPRLTLQVGDPNRISALTGLAVVADFRRRDLALGGQGAPLVCAFHHASFASAGEPRAVLNLGGIANLTELPNRDADQVRGFDTGPASGLMDEWATLHLGQAYDAEGRFAASGEVHAGLLNALLADPYFEQAPPKSCGRGEFNLDWARARFNELDSLPAADVQATLAELSALTIARGVQIASVTPKRLLVCGGGVRNLELLRRIRLRLPSVPVEPTDSFGLDAQWIEAAAFAWLAARTMNGLSGNLPAVTGARTAAVLGGVYAA